MENSHSKWDLHMSILCVNQHSMQTLLCRVLPSYYVELEGLAKFSNRGKSYGGDNINESTTSTNMDLDMPSRPDTSMSYGQELPKPKPTIATQIYKIQKQIKDSIARYRTLAYLRVAAHSNARARRISPRICNR